jgi:hypothetical protein
MRKNFALTIAYCSEQSPCNFIQLKLVAVLSGAFVSATAEFKIKIKKIH